MSVLIGRNFGRYRLDALLGRGGMAEVYKATDTKLARTVAVKVILPTHASDPRFLERFLREARLVASLEHPHVLPIYDFGEEAGVPYLVMPFLEGGTLRDRMEAGPVPVAQAVSWITQLAGALDAAHEAGVLHRDVKPANVLIGKSDRVALADFGIAKMLESVSGLTATGMVVGTPIYMAPEQAQGKPASPASDRYALAVVAYELLAGRPPFEGENALSLLHQHVATPPPSLSTRVTGLPLALDAVLARGLAKSPEERPATCRALAEEIGAALPAGAQANAQKDAPAWGGSSGDITAPTVVKTPPPSPVAVTTPPPGLTSDATVVTSTAGPRRARVAVPLALLVVALALLATWIFRRGGEKETALERTGAVPPPAAPTPAPAPTAAAGTMGTVKVVEAPAPPPKPSEAGTKGSREKPRDPRLAEMTKAVDEAIEAGRLAPPDEKNALEALALLRRDFPSAAAGAEEKLVTALRHEAERHMAEGDFAEAKGDLLQARTLKPADRDVEALLKIAEAGIARQGPRAGAPGEPESGLAESDLSLAAARHRIDPFRQPGRRLTKPDFEFARNAALEVLRQKPGKPEAQVLATFAAGAISYLDGDDAAAARALHEVATSATRNAGQALRGLGLLLRRHDAAPAPPAAWEMALAYGDARGEAESLIEKELARNPKDAKLLLGRAQLRRLQGRNEDAVAEAKKAFEAAGAPLISAAAADYLAEAAVRAGDFDEALKWYREAVRAPTALTGSVAMKAARLARDRLRREDVAEEFLRVACRAGNREACGEAKGEIPRGPARRRNRG